MQRFSKFSWALALFCLPSTLWPLALLVSPALSSQSDLTASQISWFSILFWTYPLILLGLAGLLFKLYQRHRNLAIIFISNCFFEFLCFIGIYSDYSFIKEKAWRFSMSKS